MKYLKNYLLVFGLIMGVLGSHSVMAQTLYEEEIKVTLSNPSKPGSLQVHNHNGTVDVQGYEGEEVLVKIKSHTDQKEKYKDREGLKRIPNQALNVDIVEEDNLVEIRGGQKRTDFVIKVPKQFSLDVSTHHNGEVHVSNVTGEMVIDCHHGGMKLQDVGGSLVADTHHGEIVANFLSVADRPMAFSTYHGDVDITFPPSVSCDVKIKSERGDIFTDFDVSMKALKPAEEIKDNGRREIKIGGWMKGAIGSGGQEYMFNTYHGDVIIRKS